MKISTAVAREWDSLIRAIACQVQCEQPVSWVNLALIMRGYIHLIAISVALVILTACASVPLDVPKTQSFAVTDTQGGSLAQDVTRWLGGQNGVDGIYPLTQGFDAFGARLALMAAAETSIDAQYFLMSPDAAGLVFANTMLEAADRGVRVRFLLDDIFTTVDDIDLALLDNHPNIEVRIFNPISRKGIYSLNYLGHFSLLNRRMHNKSFTVDNQVSVVGGRNIAAEYYQLESNGEFIDFDMLTVGPVVRDVSAEFDTYWNHELAVPMSELFHEYAQKKLEKTRKLLDKEMAGAGETIYGRAVNTPLLKQFGSEELVPFVADVTLISDSPDKLLQPVSDDQKTVGLDIREALLAAENEAYIFTPYFIPRKSGIELIREVRAKGVRIVVVTNSLATNNHTSVHSAYATYRKDLLRAGVELWEARADAAKIVNDDGTTQLDKLTLHTKGLLFDRKRMYAGSINLDPRSIDINTEMGLLIDSPKLVAQLTDDAERNIPRMAYRLQLDENDKISWHATIDGKEVVETREPQTSAWLRFSAWFLKIAPENQL